MKTLTVCYGDQVLQKEFEEQITAEDVIPEIETEFPIIGASVNHHFIRLNDPIRSSGTLVLHNLRERYANMSYQASLSMMYLKAVHDVLGGNVRISINNSLSKGLYTVIHTGGVNEETVAKIEAHMKKLVEEDLPIMEKEMNRDELLEYCEKHNFRESITLLESAKDLHQAMICSIGNETSMFYIHMLPSTRYLNLFDLRKYRNGVLLRFPHPGNPAIVAPFVEQKLLYDAFSEENHWHTLVGVNYAAQLNEKVCSDECLNMVMLSEALHEKKTAEIAEMIRESRKRIILIAGPSSSGKTSFAKRLCIQLQVIGLKPLYLGTDDYFINRDDMITDENGNKDFEGLSAVDVGLFTQQMNDLLAGKQVDIPEFDFIEGKKIFGKRITSVDRSQPIVIEGIHGLNPKLTEGIDDEQKLKIYISPLTQLNIDSHNRVPTTDARMLRRLIRDNRTRGRDAATTIRSWSSVREGEDVNIFPFCYDADIFFNSQCVYELAILKKYAEPLLSQITEDQDEYPEAQRMLRFLDFFMPMEDDSIIANNSIIREFIGGSILVS